MFKNMNGNINNRRTNNMIIEVDEIYLPKLDLLSTKKYMRKIEIEANISNVDVNTILIAKQKEKIYEEVGELMRSYDDIDECSELLDVIQSSLQLLEMLHNRNRNDIRDASDMHLEKLEAREWKFNGDFLIYIEKER
jgi:hypothetical protein